MLVVGNKKTMSSLAWMILALGLVFPATCFAEPFLQDSVGMVSMETEHFDANVPSGGYEWTLNYTSGYSGTGAMKAPARYYKTDYVNSPRLDYDVKFLFSGTHYLWVRAYATSSSSNSLHAGLNGGTAAGGGEIHFNAVGSYVWARASATLTIPSVGVHTVNLWGREPNPVVDKVVLTRDSGYVPSGFGPAESARESSCLTTPSVVILSPEPGRLQTAANLTITTQTCLDDVLHAGWGVKIELDGGVLGGGRESYVYAPPYERTFSGLALGEHTVGVFIVNSAGNTVSGADTQDYVDRVGIGDYYVAIGDSITEGYGDDDPLDDISLDGRNSGGGFTPILNNLLTQLAEYPHTVVNEGNGGTTSAEGLLNLPEVLQRHPDAQRFLIKYGMNDARPWVPVPSGLGLWPGDSGYPGTFKDNVQRILNLIKNNEKEALLAKTIIALGDRATGPTYEDPNTGARSLLIQQYNLVVDELFAANTDIMFYPPDFYSYFEDLYYDDEYLEEYFDNIHPDGEGYRAMAHIWFDILTLPEYKRDDPSGGTGAYLQSSLGMVSMETEHFDANVPSGGYEWTLNYTSGYSGTGAMKAPARYYKTNYVNSPRLDYEVDFLFSGTHYLWVRAYATSSSSNSLHAGLNGGTATGGGAIYFDAVGSYVWARASTALTIPSVGVHTVNLWGREPNPVVDKVVLTRDSGYVPSGFGPAESPRE